MIEARRLTKNFGRFSVLRNLDLTVSRGEFVALFGRNGAGKTTSIGKLAHMFQLQGKSVLIAAGDTFRAAAREQLQATN